MFLVGATMAGAVGKFWILDFLEALKTKFNDTHPTRSLPTPYPPLYLDPVYLLTVFLFY